MPIQIYRFARIKKKSPKNKHPIQQVCTKYVDGSTPHTRPVLFRDPVSNACVDDFAYYIGVSTQCCVSHARHESTYGKYYLYDEGHVLLFLSFANI